ncbi:bacterial Ig-like domain-containing protein [Enterococcus faecalis]|uniref:bacterial Ig-like domain-containing protein n=3 Tax=Enterococcus faecalis TaxID=1351 RepID=UPI002019278A|nr:bacterial Ig-like domain-containing protein [Enterococcus faecalis]UQQ59405.1 bacterial Ig-like domain-containing protein [Enterococcus faecalis]
MKKILCSMLILFLLLNYGIEAFAETIINENDSVTETDKNVENSSIEPEKDSQPIQPEKELPTVFFAEPYIRLKTCILPEGEDFSFDNIFISALNEEGIYIYPESKQLTWRGLPRFNKPELGLYKIECLMFGKLTGKLLARETTSVLVTEDKSSIKTKDSTLYVGQKWDPKDNFVSATDEEGKNLPWEDSRITKNGASVDTSKPGTYILVYTYQGKWKITNSSFTVTVKEDKSSIKTKDSTLYVGQKWDPKDNFVSATDEEGKNLPWEDSRITKNGASIDTSKPGTYKITYTYKGKAKNIDSSFTVTVKEDKSSIKTKDSTLYVGQKWDPKDNFVSATDEEGKNLPWEDSRITKNGASIDTSKPGTYKITYTYKGKAKNIDSSFTVTVKEDKTSLEINVGTHYIYKGEQWDPKRGLKKATDADGKEISIDKVEHWWGEGGAIDPNKIGDRRAYFYRVYRKNGSNIYNAVFVQVKEDKSSIKTKDSTLYVGQKWDPKDNFVSATDEDGRNIPWEDSRITKNGASIDTSKPGTYKITYTYKGKAKNIDSSFTVTVKEEPFTIKHVPHFDFEDYILVSTNKSVVNKKENPTIDLETPSMLGKNWQLQVELSPFLDKKNSKSILKGVSLFIPKGKLESDLETEEPTQYDCQLEANGKASILMQGTKTKGKGRWKNKLATKGITLSIPPENKTGDFESTLYWTLLDVPG